MRKYRLLIAIVAAMVMALLPTTGALAATTAPVTITALPAYIALTVSPNGWTVNDLVGAGGTPKGTIKEDTIYYSNPLGDCTVPSDPVVDGECYFTITNTSSITTDVFINVGDFTGGSAEMTNSNDGTNSGTNFGCYSYCTGMTYSSGKVVCKSSASALTKADLAPSTNIKFGVMIETRTNAWTGGTASTSVMVASLAAT